MIGWLAFTYSLLLLGITVAVLLWVYRRTRLTAVLVYLIYTIISRFFVPDAYVNTILDGNAGRWLGATMGDRAAHYFLLTSTVENTVQTLLFLWLIFSLVGWVRSDIGGPLNWRVRRRSVKTLEQHPDTA